MGRITVQRFYELRSGQIFIAFPLITEGRKLSDLPLNFSGTLKGIAALLLEKFAVF